MIIPIEAKTLSHILYYEEIITKARLTTFRDMLNDARVRATHKYYIVDNVYSRAEGVTYHEILNSIDRDTDFTHRRNGTPDLHLFGKFNDL